MTFLLDTNVLSETRKRQPSPQVAEWINVTPPDRLHVSVLTLGEPEQCVARIRGRGDRRQAAALERWLRDLEIALAERVLPVTLAVATAWGPTVVLAATPGGRCAQRRHSAHTA